MTNSPTTKSIICIAGAHRSGTSMLTRLLHLCDLRLGTESDLMAAQPDNPEGFWENLRFVQLNDEILNVSGGAWDLPPPPDVNFAAPAYWPAHAKARLLVESFDPNSTWGWKDPRNCLTLPFWRGIIPGLKVVVVVRNPLEVAYSMRARNGFSYALGLRLWEIYNRRLLADTRPEERIITSYQSFFEEPEAELKRIVAFAGLSLDQTPAAAEIVAHDRRHTAFTKEQLIDAGVSERVVALYESLLREGEQSHPKDEDNKPSSQEQILSYSDPAESSTGDQLAGAASALNFSILEAETVRRELAWRRGSEIEYQEKLEQLRARIEGLVQEIGRRDGRIMELQSERDRLLSEQSRNTSELNQVRERFFQTNRLLHEHSIKLAERETESISLKERLRKQLQETKRLLRLLDEIENAAGLLRKSRRWLLANPFAALVAKFSSRPLPGFGHLDKNVEKYRAWRSAHPDSTKLDDAIAALLPRQSPTHPAWSENGAATSLRPRAEIKPAAPRAPIRFLRYKEAEVSVIIPVFNQVDFTQACLASLQEFSDDVKFEVVVVDDCSTDATKDIVGALPGIVYLRNDSNVGFVASCNRGAEKASGTYLAFLNNDTTVMAGSLRSLLETFSLEPQAGLVGSKLIYPDGRLQEAGGIVWQDGSGWNRGKFQDAAAPEYNYLREVDYCSAASIMIPKSLFEKLGGFEERYRPAYYEDTDLAFKVAQSGHKVLYQPLSVVIHYEGITGGTDTAAGTKKHQEINRQTFSTLWAERLLAKPPNGDLPAWEAQSHRGRILVIDHHLPLFDRDSGSLRMLEIVTLLNQMKYRVTFIPDNLADIPPYGDELRKRGIEVVHHPYIRSVGDYLQTHGADFDYVILSRCDFARKHIAAVRLHAPRAKVIFDTVDLHFLREEREATLTKNIQLEESALAKRQLEFELIGEADQTWVVSPVERELLLRDWPDKSIEVVSNIVAVPGSRTPFNSRCDLLFIGSFQHPPNVDAVIFFTREIFQLVRQQLTDANFYIIGDKAPPEVISLADERVIVTGFQSDVRSYFDNVRLSVAPLRYGAGIKGKINQSMGFGVPVVATSVAVEGMGLTDREDVMIADNPHAFANAVIELYTSPSIWDRLSKNGREKTASAFSKEAATKQLERLFSESHRTPPGRLRSARLSSPPLQKDDS
ncbi:MAG: glycosyltransferase [Acidobacteriota bacterium]